MPPLITSDYSADPSAHVFQDRIYIYPSHDRVTSIAPNASGDQYDMVDYHVYSTGGDDLSTVTDHGVVLRAQDVPWVSKQMWAPDAAFKNGTYFLFFPARNKSGTWQIGVALSSSPSGPFTPDPDPLAGSYSIDPASFVDSDGQAYLYFGGLWGGQLQCYQGDEYDPSWVSRGERTGGDQLAQGPRVARLADDMRSLASSAIELAILDPDTGAPLAADDHDRRFFEGSWMHKRMGTYYFSYSTGDTHFLCYATGASPLGPFTYAGKILEPVLGWTTHHSIVEYHGRTYLFYHDCELSGGVDHLRSVKLKEIFYDENGRIITTTAD
ncbi:Glycosyl hydrolases family 43 [Geosmithia morbida]|uniref:Glycosyl hydrolases family 43 n=1 Tax=Geosmithia morbida TaxID=1094350 RepID=A0A9P4YNN7_9HYPO|nr:Glycosyl hydrolases family 43 [Geosmithia morbida]KAF4119910.1 Glycosyl hydrolases family 43 [Geosmithia morbida]